MKLEQVKQYIGIDFQDDDTLLEDIIIPGAAAWMQEAVGWTDENDPEWKMLFLLLAQDMYENRCLAETSAANQRNFNPRSRTGSDQGRALCSKHR